LFVHKLVFAIQIIKQEYKDYIVGINVR